MALDPDNDLLIVQKPATKAHFKLKIADLGTVPDGLSQGQYLVWTAAGWTPSDVIDCGEYAT